MTRNNAYKWYNPIREWLIPIAVALLVFGGFLYSLQYDNHGHRNVAWAAAPTATTTPALSTSGLSTSVAIGNPGEPSDVTVTFSIATGAKVLATGDYIALAKIPQGAVITDWYLSIPDLDSSTSLTLTFGTSSSSALLVATPVTTGQAGGVLTYTTSGVVVMPAAVLTADDILRLTAAAGANATPPAGGTLKGWVRYNMRGAAF